MFNRHPFTAASIEAQSATPLRRAALVCLSALALTVALAGCAQPWQQYTRARTHRPSSPASAHRVKATTCPTAASG